MQVGVPMMITVDDIADVAAFANYVYSEGTEAPAAPTSSVAAVHTPAAVTIAAVTQSVSAPATVTSSSAPTGGRVIASPLARKLIRDAGLPSTALEGIKGSGPGGRVVSADVINAIAVGIPSPTATVAHATATPGTISAAPTPAPLAYPAVSTQMSGSSVYSDFELSDLAKSVAARQTAAKQQVPHYYLSVELNLTKLILLRNELNGSKGSLSVLDFIVKASALAVNQVK